MSTRLTLGGMPPRNTAAARARATLPPRAQPQRIPGAFQLILALYIILTGDTPTILQAIAFGVEGGAISEFAAAMITSLARDLLLLVPVVMLARHPLGILHPLLIAVVVWPLVIGMPRVIEEFGGWAAVLAGLPVDAPFFVGLPSRDAVTIWTAIAKYNGVEIAALLSVYAGFWLFKAKDNPVRIPTVFPNTLAVRTVLLAMLALSLLVLVIFVYSRGGVGAHLTSLGRGRFRELADVGAIMVLTDLGAIAIYLWIALRPQDAKSSLFILSLIAVAATQFISNGSRGSAILVLITVAIIWALRQQRVPWRLALFLLPAMFVSLGLLSAVRTSSWTDSTAGEAWSSTGWAESFELAQQEIAIRRALSAQVPIIERGFEVSGGPLYGRSYIGAVTAFIPRTLWKEKPRGTASLYAQMFLGHSNRGAAIPVSAEAEMYWNFGLPGLVLLSFIYGALLRVVYIFYWRRFPNPLAIVFYVFILTSFSFSTEALVGLQQQLVLLFLCYWVVSFVVPKVVLSGGSSAGRLDLQPVQP